MMPKQSAFSYVLATAAMLLVHIASADEAFDIKTGKGEITVVTKGHWHVNKDYSWRVTAGDKTLDKAKFSLTDTSAKVTGVPQGTVKIKGAVCNGDQCMPFGREVAVE